MTDQALPQHQIIIEPSHGWVNLQLRALWQYRELLYFLVWRDIKVRYKQTAQCMKKEIPDTITQYGLYVSNSSL